MDITPVIETISNLIMEYNTVLLILIIFFSVITLVLQILSYRIDLKYSKILWVNMSLVDKKKLIATIEQIMWWEGGKTDLNKSENLDNNKYINVEWQVSVDDIEINDIISVDNFNGNTNSDIDYNWLTWEEILIENDHMLIPSLKSTLRLSLIDWFKKILSSNILVDKKINIIKNIIKVAIKNNATENGVMLENMFIALSKAILEYQNRSELLSLIDILDKVKLKYKNWYLPEIVDKLR